jgi:hypothetical protein
MRSRQGRISKLDERDGATADAAASHRDNGEVKRTPMLSNSFKPIWAIVEFRGLGIAIFIFRLRNADVKILHFLVLLLFPCDHSNILSSLLHVDSIEQDQIWTFRIPALASRKVVARFWNRNSRLLQDVEPPSFAYRASRNAESSSFAIPASPAPFISSFLFICSNNIHGQFLCYTCLQSFVYSYKHSFCFL